MVHPWHYSCRLCCYIKITLDIMANSFNISVKPEIAAVKAVLDANSVILVDVHDTDLPAAVTKIDANKTVIDENKVILVDLHDTDLPAALTSIGNNLTAIGANNTILADLHDTDLPEAVTKIDANQTSLIALDTLIDSVKAKTDLIPDNIRGTQANAAILTDSATYVTLLDITSVSGKITFICMKNTADSNMSLLLTIDGGTSLDLTNSNFDTVYYVCPAYSSTPILALGITTSPFCIPIEFTSSLNLQVRRILGSGSVLVSMAYNLD